MSAPADFALCQSPAGGLQPLTPAVFSGAQAAAVSTAARFRATGRAPRRWSRQVVRSIDAKFATSPWISSASPWRSERNFGVESACDAAISSSSAQNAASS